MRRRAGACAPPLFLVLPIICFSPFFFLGCFCLHCARACRSPLCRGDTHRHFFFSYFSPSCLSIFSISLLLSSPPDQFFPLPPHRRAVWGARRSVPTAKSPSARVPSLFSYRLPSLHSSLSFPFLVPPPFPSTLSGCCGVWPAADGLFHGHIALAGRRAPSPQHATLAYAPPFLAFFFNLFSLGAWPRRHHLFSFPLPPKPPYPTEVRSLTRGDSQACARAERVRAGLSTFLETKCV